MTATELTSRQCKPCEGGVPPLSPDEVKAHLSALPQWQLAEDGKHIRRKWKLKDFVTALEFLNRVGDVAEAEDHHPDLHLTGYRHVMIELSTHAVGGLSENDFILAAKIDALGS